MTNYNDGKWHGWNGGEYNEAQVAVMVDDRGMAVQVFASAQGTWTIATLGEDGIACIVATGDRFAMVAPGEYN